MDRYTVHNHKNILIINADDFGFNSHIDQGIYQLLRQRKIKSTSVVVNGANIQNAVKMVQKLKEEDMELYLQCSFGLHLNLTQGKPMNDKLVGTVIAPQGSFIGKPKLYEIIDKIDENIVNCIEEEVRMQIRQFSRLFHRRPSHLDGHNHVTHCPKIAKAIANAMIETGIYRGRALNQKLQKITISMNHTFLNNYESTKKIFEERNIIKTQNFVGLQILGKLEAKAVQNAFIEQSQSQKSVQLMCHPGYPDQNSIPWFASNDRLLQLNQLKSQQFDVLRQKRHLCSYLDLKEISNQTTPKLLIYSKLEKGTGNCTTTLRLKEMYEKMGFIVYLWNTDDKIDLKVEASDLFYFLLNFGITIILGVNVSRSAQIIHEAVKKIAVPYILMVAGTDANITFKSQEGLSKVVPAIRDCECMVSLSYGMQKVTKEVFEKIKIDKKIYTITQSSCISVIDSQKQEKSWAKPEKQYILFPTSFRKVKCVHHILAQLNTLIDYYNMDVYVAGPIIDHQYYESCIGKLGRIKYIGVIPKQLYKVYLHNCFAVINTSESQGMSCSILEAFQMKKPVIVRKNQGNCQLVRHMNNGLVYEHPKQFLPLFDKLKKDDSLRQNLVRNSHYIFLQKYSIQRQISQYQQVLSSHFSKQIFKYKNLKIFNSESVHPASQVNAELMDQIRHPFKNGDTLLDVGCGSGIFSIIVLTNSAAQNIQLWLSDISLSIAARSLYNLRQSQAWKKVKIINCVQSNWFDNLKNTNQFNVILFNPPQSPFRTTSSRPDKNGGPQAIKYIQPVLSYFSQHNPTILYELYSFMAWPSRYQEIIQKLKLKIVWSSTQGVHKIEKQNYNSMQQNLAEYIIEHWKQGKAYIRLQNDIFEVPAIVHRIEPC